MSAWLASASELEDVLADLTRALDDGDRMKEQARISWDSAGRAPAALRVGIGRSSAGAATTVFTDEIRLTESHELAQPHISLTRDASRSAAVAPS